MLARAFRSLAWLPPGTVASLPLEEELYPSHPRATVFTHFQQFTKSIYV